MNGFNNSLVEQSLTDIAVKERHAADPETSESKCDLERSLVPAKAPDIVQCQAVKVHDHHARAHKQRQFEQRMVDHMLHCAGQRCHHGFFLADSSHEHRHCHARQDKSDLRHGGTSQRALEIDREQRQNCSQQHGDHSRRQHDQPEPEISGQHIERCHQDSVYADLGQYA